jgi:hypothetical protein
MSTLNRKLKLPLGEDVLEALERSINFVEVQSLLKRYSGLYEEFTKNIDELAVSKKYYVNKAINKLTYHKI